MATERELAAAQFASVIAPAGYGKTELIVKALALGSDRPSLVLTHTHAGVNALRSRMARMKIRPQLASIETLDGFALRWATKYQSISGVANDAPTGAEWAKVAGGASKVLGTNFAKDVLTASYSGVFVDEYQDCSMAQHALVLHLADTLPTRVLGDPLQAIFGFGGQTVEWSKHVLPRFPALPDLDVAWRWRGKNEDLAMWLATCRLALQAGQKIDLREAPKTAVNWVHVRDGDEIFAIQDEVLRRLKVSEGEGAAGLHKWRPQCYETAGRLNGLYTALEEMDLSGLTKYARIVDDGHRHFATAAVIELASDCHIGLADFGAIVQTLKSAKAPSKKGRKRHIGIVEAIERALASESRRDLADLFLLCAKIPGAKCSRWELADESRRALAEWVSDEELSLSTAASRTRDITRRLGRRPYRRSLGTPLLLKGLEFEHAVVLDAQALSTKELYVAMTRGSRSLTVISRQPLIG